MNVPDEMTAAPRPRRLWLLGVPVLAGLIWIGLSTFHKPHEWRQALHEFRGDAAADPGPNRPMASALLVRRSLMLHPELKLTLAQSATLVGLINSPVNDLSQSEALDVLSLAQRANDLSAGQAQRAQEATLVVLSHNPGPMVRLESARFLGHLGDAHGISALTALRRDDDPKVREAAQQALTRLPN